MLFLLTLKSLVSSSKGVRKILKSSTLFKFNAICLLIIDKEWLSKNLPLKIKEGYLENFPVCFFCPF